MSLAGEYSINDNDLYTSFGFVVGDSINGLLKFPDRKEPFSHDWTDQNGIEVDLSKPVFKSKDIPISGTLMALNTDDFWLKHTALFTELAKPGTLRFYSAALGRSFFLYYNSSSSFEKLTTIRIGTQTRVGCKYTLNFVEPVPSFWQKYSYLTDINGDYITTNDGYKILITT
jgi:hypothetical protein